MGRRRSWLDLAYTRRCIAHGPDWARYKDTGESWYNLDAIRLTDFEPQIWLVPLPGHSRGHCGVAIQTPDGWLFHVGESAPMEFIDDVPDWLVRLVLGGHGPRLRAFRHAHPEIRMATGHMWLSFFEDQT